MLEVDLFAPEFAVARTEKLTQIRVEFDDQTIIRGGCNPQQWDVEGHLVTKVLFSDETECTSPPNSRGRGTTGKTSGT